jgi:F0F1-type ATP synthase assembly protein I
MWGTLLIGLVGMALSQLLKPTLNAHPWLAVLMLLGIAVCTLVLFAIAMARLGE